MTNIVPFTDKSRHTDGKIIPSEKKRAMIEIDNILRENGTMNISAIAKLYNTTRRSIREIIKEVLTTWAEEKEPEYLVQIGFYKNVLHRINDPKEVEKFKFQDEQEKVRFQSAIMDLINNRQEKLAILDPDAVGKKLKLTMELWGNSNPELEEKARKMVENMETKDDEPGTTN